MIADIGSHALDLARYLVGDLASISVRSRSVLAPSVDDDADLHLQFASGATGHIWLSWLASGTPMDVGFHVMGDRGAIRFSWSRPSELAYYDATVPAAERGFRTIPLGPEHGPAAPTFPSPVSVSAIRLRSYPCLVYFSPAIPPHRPSQTD